MVGAQAIDALYEKCGLGFTEALSERSGLRGAGLLVSF
jgi:hypothetical protein